MKTGDIITVKQYNNWVESNFTGNNRIVMLYRNIKTGENKKTGYVKITEHGSKYSRTKSKLL